MKKSDVEKNLNNYRRELNALREARRYSLQISRTLDIPHGSTDEANYQDWYDQHEVQLKNTLYIDLAIDRIENYLNSYEDAKK